MINYKLVNSFQIRQICPLRGFKHRLSCPARPPSPAPSCLNPGPMPLKPPPSPHRLYDLQGTLDKRMHFVPQLSDFVPLKTGLIVSVHRLTDITLLTLIATL